MDGPNAEYPWPSHEQVSTPASYEFPIWTSLTETVRGRNLLRAINAAVQRFPEYAQPCDTAVRLGELKLPICGNMILTLSRLAARRTGSSVGRAQD